MILFQPTINTENQSCTYRFQCNIFSSVEDFIRRPHKKPTLIWYKSILRMYIQEGSECKSMTYVTTNFIHVSKLSRPINWSSFPTFTIKENRDIKILHVRVCTSCHDWNCYRMLYAFHNYSLCYFGLVLLVCSLRTESSDNREIWN